MTTEQLPEDDWGTPASTHDLLGGETWRFDEQGPLIGTYIGKGLRDTRYGDERLIHHFADDDGAVWDVWGSAGLNGLLDDHMDHYVRVVRTERVITTSRGLEVPVWEVSCKTCR